MFKYVAVRAAVVLLCLSCCLQVNAANGIDVLGSGLYTPTTVSISAASSYSGVYTAECMCPSSGAATITRCNNGTKTVVAQGVAYPFGVVNDQSYVYFSQNSEESGAIRKVSHQGGAITTLATAYIPHFLYLAGNNLFWAEEHTGDAGSSIRNMKTDGSSLVTLATSPGMVVSLAVDSNNVYWADMTDGSIRKVTKSTHAISVLASEQSLLFVSQIALDDNYVYWTDAGTWDYDGSIKRVSKSGGPITILAAGLNNPTGITCDSGNVYWTEGFQYDQPSTDGKVCRMPAAGGPATTMAMGLNNPFSITTDANYVYWTECTVPSQGDNGCPFFPPQDGTIKRASKSRVMLDQTIAEARADANGTNVVVENGYVTAVFGDAFYMESYDRDAGIRVEGSNTWMLIGMLAGVAGTVSTNANGEKCIAAEMVVQSGIDYVQPLGMNNKCVGGGNWNYDPATGTGQKGVTGGAGLNNIGLLVTTTGMCTYVDPHTFTIDDGSGVNLTCSTTDAVPVDSNWKQVVVTGISSVTKSGSSYYRLLRVNGVQPLSYFHAADVAGRWEMTNSYGTMPGVLGMLLTQDGNTVQGTIRGIPIMNGEINGGILTGYIIPDEYSGQMNLWASVSGDTLTGTIIGLQDGNTIPLNMNRLSPNPVSPYTGIPHVLSATCDGTAIDVTWDRPICGWDYDVISPDGYSIAGWNFNFNSYDPATHKFHIALDLLAPFENGRTYTIKLDSGDTVDWFDPYGAPAWTSVADAYSFTYTPGEGIASDKHAADGDSIYLDDMVVTDNTSAYFYAEKPDRLWGIRVEGYSGTLQEGQRVSIDGTLHTNSDGERYIQTTSVVPPPPITTTVRPLAMVNRDLGGTNFSYDPATGAGQMGVAGGRGLNNIGLLVATTGMCTYVDDHTFVLDDGSGVHVTCETTDKIAVNSNWKQVAVAGISSIRKSGSEYKRLLRVTGVQALSYFQTVDVTGRWEMTTTSGNGCGVVGMLLTQQGDVVEGTIRGTSVYNGHVNGNVFTGQMYFDDWSGWYDFSLTLSGETLSGTLTKERDGSTLPMAISRVSPNPVSPYTGIPHVVSATCDGSSINITWDRPVNGWDYDIIGSDGYSIADWNYVNNTYDPITHTYHIGLDSQTQFVIGQTYTIKLDSGDTVDWHDPYGAPAWDSVEKAYSFQFGQPWGPPTPGDDSAIRALFASLKIAFESHDAAAITAAISPNFMHNGTDRATQMFYMQDALDHISTVTCDITSISVLGDKASVTAPMFVTFDNQAPMSWTEPYSGDDGGLGMGWLTKENGKWLVYGNQIRGQARVTVGHNMMPGDDHYFFRFRANGPNITSVTVSGQGIPSNTVMPHDDRWGGCTAIVNTSQTPKVGDTYTFNITYSDNHHETLRDSVAALINVAPPFTVTPGPNHSLTISWSDVSSQVPNAGNYMVSIGRSEGDIWTEDFPINRTSALFNEDGTATGNLQSGHTYNCFVHIQDSHNDFAYTYKYFTMP